MDPFTSFAAKCVRKARYGGWHTASMMQEMLPIEGVIIGEIMAALVELKFDA